MITIDLKEFEHIKEKSSYNNNYYHMKPEFMRHDVPSEIKIETDEYANSSREYLIGHHYPHFLFCCIHR